MKIAIVTTALILSSSLVYAQDCEQGVGDFFDSVAPSTREIIVKGKYIKKSRQTGEYKTCELSVKQEDGRLITSWDNEKLDPNNGDGGALWPFNSFPTSLPESDSFRIVRSYNCSANQQGFFVDFSYRSSGRLKGMRNGLKISKNDDATYDVKLTTGRGDSVVCRGEISEK